MSKSIKLWRLKTYYRIGFDVRDRHVIVLSETLEQAITLAENKHGSFGRWYLVESWEIDEPKICITF